MKEQTSNIRHPPRHPMSGPTPNIQLRKSGRGRLHSKTEARETHVVWLDYKCEIAQTDFPQ
jgi:hypothetical protein